jgi:hypothetical protein
MTTRTRSLVLVVGIAACGDSATTPAKDNSTHAGACDCATGACD